MIGLLAISFLVLKLGGNSEKNHPVSPEIKTSRVLRHRINEAQCWKKWKGVWISAWEWMSESVIHLIRLIHLIHLFHLQTFTILQPVDEWVSEEEGVGRVEPLHQTRCNPDQVHSKVHSVPGLLVLIFEYIFIRTRHDVIQINSSTFLLLPWVNS